MTTPEERYEEAERECIRRYGSVEDLRSQYFMAGFLDAAMWSNQHFKLKIKALAKEAWDEGVKLVYYDDKWFDEWFAQNYPEYI